ERLATEPPSETGALKKWLTHKLNEDHIATTREIESWLSGHTGPRKQLLIAFQDVLGMSKKSILRAMREIEPVQPSLLEMGGLMPAPSRPTGTEKFPVLNASPPGLVVNHSLENLARPINPQRIIR